MKWLKQPEISAALISAFVGAAVLLVIAFVAYPYQKDLDRQEERRALDLQISMELLEAIGSVAQAHVLLTREGDEGRKQAEIEKARRDFAVVRMRFAAIGSDDAVRNVGKLQLYFSRQEKAEAREIDSLIAAIIRDIRKQLLDKTNLSNEELLAITPFTVGSK